MATLGKNYQAIVKDSSTVLVGVAQVRIGKPSIRTGIAAEVRPLAAVGKTDRVADVTDTGVMLVKPRTNYFGSTNKNTCTDTAAAAFTVTVATGYTGRFDGCFIIRGTAAGDTGLTGSDATPATSIEVYAPNGYKQTITLTNNKTFSITTLNMSSTPTTSGLQLTGTATASINCGDTWVIPVWCDTVGANAIDRNQTLICSPFSMFQAANESVGGLKDASFTPKIDSVKSLESGFPAEVVDKVIEKTSVDIKFSSLEYTNANLAYLKNVISNVINEAKMPGLPCEVVMRTRGNELVTFWCSNSTVNQFPSYAPTNDFSSVSWEMEAARMTEITQLPAGDTTTDLTTLNAWLRNSRIYQELTYVH